MENDLKLVIVPMDLCRAKYTLTFIMKNFKFKKVALWFLILQFPTGTPGRFLRVGVFGGMGATFPAKSYHQHRITRISKMFNPVQKRVI